MARTSTSTSAPVAACACTPCSCTPPAPATNTFSVVSFVLSFTVPLAAVVFGALGLKQAKEKNEAGRNYAIAGLVISGVHILTALAVGGVMLLGALASMGSHHSMDRYRMYDSPPIMYTEAAYPVPADMGDGFTISGVPTVSIQG